MISFRNRACVPALVAMLALCSCAEDSVDDDVPKSRDSGFSMALHSLGFPNFANGFPASQVDADLLVRMFGMAGVCVGDNATPCTLTPAARAFMNTANASMNGGRCEGFAVLASLLFSGAVDPSAFGAGVARDLSLWDNTSLQREIAYWFSTQMVQEVVGKKTRALMASELMPFLANELTPGAKEQWRLGIVRKDGNGISGGHSLTPIAYYEVSEGIYELRVYDNNDPDHEHVLRIDTAKNRWEFEATPDPLRPSVLYFGDESNDNPMYFAPVSTRLGTLPCRFCAPGSGVEVATVGGVQAEVKDQGGATTGVRNGQVTSGDGSVSPVLAGNLYLTSPNWLIDANVAGAYTVSLGASVADPSVGATVGGVTAFGKGYVVSARGLLLSMESTDVLAVSENGDSVSYTNQSGTDLTLSTAVSMSSDPTVQIEVETSYLGGFDSVGLLIDPGTGKVTVNAAGAPAGQLSVSVTVANGRTGEVRTAKVEFPSGSENVSFVADTNTVVTGGVLTGSVDHGDGQPPTRVTSTCTGTGVGCGGDCALRCDVGQACVSATDCASNACSAETKLCVESACLDGVKDEAETDIDCGSPSCAPCPNGKRCLENGDCRSQVCSSEKFCVATYAVWISVSGVPGGASLVLQNNGGDDLTVPGDGFYRFATPVTGPYAVTVLAEPPFSTCSVANGGGFAAADVTTVQVECVPRIFEIRGEVRGMPTGATLTLSNNGSDLISLQSDGPFTFRQPAGNYRVDVLAGPAGASCVVEDGEGVATGDATGIVVQCNSAIFQCTPVDGLVGCWPFDGHVMEVTSANSYGAQIRGAILTEDRNSRDAHAYAFDGASEIRMTVPQLPAGASARTVSAWFKTTGANQINVVANWGARRTAERSGLLVHHAAEGNHLLFVGEFNDFWTVGLTPPFPNDEWHHGLVTYDGDKGIAIWLDGQKIASGSLPRPLNTTGTELVIGNAMDGDPEFFSGVIDDMRIWSRALTDAEIATLYSEGPQ